MCNTLTPKPYSMNAWRPAQLFCCGMGRGDGKGRGWGRWGRGWRAAGRSLCSREDPRCQILQFGRKVNGNSNELAHVVARWVHLITWFGHCIKSPSADLLEKTFPGSLILFIVLFIKYIIKTNWSYSHHLVASWTTVRSIGLLVPHTFLAQRNVERENCLIVLIWIWIPEREWVGGTMVVLIPAISSIWLWLCHFIYHEENSQHSLKSCPVW